MTQSFEAETYGSQRTARTAVDLGFHVTLVRDATAAFSHETMHAAHDITAQISPTWRSRPQIS